MHYLIAIIVSLSAALPAAAREHPYLFFSRDDIPAFKEKVQNVPWSAKAFKRMQQAVEEHGEVTLPPADGSIMNHWRPALVRNGRTAQYAAFLYLLTGEERYLDIARTFLLTYAKHFDERVNFHHLSDKDGMRIFTTGGLGVRSAWTYDMVHDALTPEQRDTVETGLLRAIVAMVKRTATEQNYQDAWAKRSDQDKSDKPLDYSWNAGQWNGVLYCNTGITAIGFALQDSVLIEHGIANWKTYLARDMLNDGMWIEEDYAYSRFCFSSMITVAEMAFRCGYPENLYTVKLPSKPAAEWDPAYAMLLPYAGKDRGYRTLKMYLDAQLDAQYPDLSPTNLGWQQNAASFLAKDTDVTFYELGYLRYGDPLYGWLLKKMDRTRGNYYVQADMSPVMYGDPVEAVRPTGTASRIYDHSGWAVLKSVEGMDYWESDALYAFIPYASSRTKGIMRLSVDLFGLGRCVAPRVAKWSRHQAHDKDYYLHDDSWNNLMVDGENLSGIKHHLAGSRLRFSDLTPEIKIVQPVLDVERVVRPSIWYDDVAERRPQDDFTMSRTLGLTDTYLFDVTAVRFKTPSAYKHTFTWNWHGLDVMPEIKGVRSGERTPKMWHATWRDTGRVGLRTTVLGSRGRGLTKVRRLKSDGSGYVKAFRGNYGEVFAAVHEPFRDSARIDEIVKLAEDTVSVAVKITDTGAFTDYICAAFDADMMAVDKDGERIVLDGYYGYIRNAGTELRCRGNVASFVLKGGPVKTAYLNGEKIKVTCRDGLITYVR